MTRPWILLVALLAPGLFALPVGHNLTNRLGPEGAALVVIFAQFLAAWTLPPAVDRLTHLWRNR